MIPAQSGIEAHILFDFNIDTMLGILDDVIVDLAGDLIDGRTLGVDIPYTMDGSSSMSPRWVGILPTSDRSKTPGIPTGKNAPALRVSATPRRELPHHGKKLSTAR